MDAPRSIASRFLRPLSIADKDEIAWRVRRHPRTQCERRCNSEITSYVLSTERRVHPTCDHYTVAEMNRFLRWAFRMIERFLATRTNGFIATSKEELEHLIGIGIDSHKIHLIPNAIDVKRVHLDRVAIRKRLNLSEDRTLIGFVGRLSKQKNPTMLLDSFRIVAERFPEVDLVVIGKGDFERQAIRRAAHLGLEKRVQWLGFQDGGESIAAFDILAIPSLYETGPIVMLEAMTAGVPVVITDVGSASVTIENGKSGFIVPVGATQQFADRISELVAKPDLRHSFSYESRLTSKKINLASMVDATLEVYNQTLTGS